MTTVGSFNFMPGIRQDVVPCALVLEDSPSFADDGRLDFESFPGTIDQAYNVSGYREIAASRMAQPGFAAYRGGNWNVLSFDLVFRAGRTLTQFTELNRLANVDLNNLLSEMEHKVRWCEALTMPKEREAVEFNAGFRARLPQLGTGAALERVEIAQLRRTDPPIVLVVFGSFLTIRGYVTATSIKWEGPWHPITAQPFGCTVNLSIQRIDTEYPDWNSVRNQAGFSTAAAQRIKQVARLDLGAIPTRSALERAISNRRTADNAGAAAP